MFSPHYVLTFQVKEILFMFEKNQAYPCRSLEGSEGGGDGPLNGS